MQRLLLAFVMLTSAGCPFPPFSHFEPNPIVASEGLGYVDFYHDGVNPIPCNWVVYQHRELQNIWGGTYTLKDRMDGRIYLVEIFAKAHRLVRVESKPGSQDFHIYCSFDSDVSKVLKVAVVAGMVTPVRLSFGTRVSYGLYTGQQSAEKTVLDLKARVEELRAYKPKENMPYYPNE